MTMGITSSLSRPATASPFVRILLATCFVFSFPAFTLQLSMNLTTGQWVGSPILQATTISTEFISLAVILSSHRTMTFAFRCWPIWLLIMTAFLSAAFSRNPMATIHTANTYATTAVLGVAIAAALPQFESIRFCTRIMVLGCVLSILWVFLFPLYAIHQLTDPYQTVHAGLWRGIFSHKQGLGVHAGLTTGLLLFYRTLIFRMPIFVVSLLISLACLVGTQSATGAILAVITPAFLYFSYWIAHANPAARKARLIICTVGFVGVFSAYEFGLLNFIITQILSKSTDLSGRADFWPIELANFSKSGRTLFGGGFGAGEASLLSEWSVDNGYLDKFFEFGYVFGAIVLFVFCKILWSGVKLLLNSPPNATMTNIFPSAIWLVILITNITESNFMYKNASTVLTSVIVGIIVNATFKQPAKAVPQRKIGRVQYAGRFDGGISVRPPDPRLNFRE